jgi:hypothetical protein
VGSTLPLFPGFIALQAGPNAVAASSTNKGSLTCHDSLLVGWGGATDRQEHNMSSPVATVMETGSSLELERCTIQLHPDSTHSLPTPLLAASGHAQVKAVSCKFVGPAPGQSTAKAVGAALQDNASGTLVGDDVASCWHNKFNKKFWFSDPGQQPGAVVLTYRKGDLYDTTYLGLSLHAGALLVPPTATAWLLNRV